MTRQEGRESVVPILYILSICLLASSCAANLGGSLDESAHGGPSDDDGASPPTLPPRTLTLDFAGPLDSYDANSSAWLSVNEVFARGSDYLGIRQGLDENLLGRGLLTFGAYYFSVGPRHYSHEVGHEFEFVRHGQDRHFRLDLSDWSAHWWPRYLQPSANYAVLSEDETLRLTAGGLNQDELNARNIWGHCMLKGSYGLHDAFAFLLPKFWDFRYILNVGLDDRRPGATELSMTAFRAYCLANDLWNDVDTYTLFLYNRNIDVTKRDYLKQVLAADLLSWHTWQSAAVIWNYVAHGRRTTSPAVLKLGENTELSPPLVTHYLTPNGSFYDAAVFLNPRGRRPVLLSFGTHVDFIGDGEVDRLRLGVEFRNLRLGRLSVAPFAYANFSTPLAYQGSYLGTELRVHAARVFELRASMGWSDNDMVENIVKGHEDGFRLRAGIDIRF